MDVLIEPQPVENSTETSTLYNPLGLRIKSSLISQRKESPTVKIELPIDKVLFEKGIKVYGTESRNYRRYKITT